MSKKKADEKVIQKLNTLFVKSLRERFVWRDKQPSYFSSFHPCIDSIALIVAIKQFDKTILDEAFFQMDCPKYDFSEFVKFDKLDTASRQMRQRIDRIIEREALEVTVRGPMPAVISRIQRFHRMQIIIQAPEATTIQRLFSRLRTEPPIRPAVKVAIDIDPINLL